MVNQEEKQLTGETDSEETQIMVVDDEEGILKFMKGSLQNHGHKVTVCTDTEQIKNAVYDLIITNLNMPKLSGVEFVKKAKGSLPELI